MQLYIKIDTDNNIIGFVRDPAEGFIGPVELDPLEKIHKSKLRKYINDEVVLVDNQEYIIAKQSALNKRVKEDLISKSFVTTTTGKVFDGDEKSQDRMIRAISIAGLTGETVTEWKMYDNTIIVVTLDELKEAVIKAGKSMSNIWLDKTDQ